MMEPASSSTDMPSYYTSPPSQPPNPYARMSSRRAIACVTCAKAKTKCDKALPACSRCITKGIKCDPRSTRRTSDNSYRTNIKKPFMTKRYHSSDIVPSLSRHTSPRSIPASTRHKAMRAASHIDFRTAVKMSQQAGVSGFPMLTPLPTYASQIVDECYSYSSSPEQNLGDITNAMDANIYPDSGRFTPQTPEPIVYHGPISMSENLDHYMISQPWTDEALATVGLGFETDMTAMLPTDMWSAPEPSDMIPIAQIPWPHSDVSVSPQSISTEFVAHNGPVPSLSTSECSTDDFNCSIPSGDEWAVYQSDMAPITAGTMTPSVPFMIDMKSIPSHAPIWEDVYIPGPSPY